MLENWMAKFLLQAKHLWNKYRNISRNYNEIEVENSNIYFFIAYHPQ